VNLQLSAPPASDNERSQQLVWIAAAAAFCLSIALFHGFVVVDDAYITYRYAANLLAHQGFVFNAGERVEGITNLLWAAIAAIGLRLGFAPDTFCVTVGLGLALCAVYELWRCCRLLGAPSLAAGVSVTAVSAHPSYWLVAGNGLEAGLVTFLLTRMVRCVLSNRLLQAGLLGGALFATRPDALSVIPFVAAWHWIYGPTRSVERRSSSHDLVSLVGLWSLIVAAITLGRLWYFGQWLPNTIRAKIPPPGVAQALENAYHGASYLAHFGLAIPVQLIAILIVLFVGPARRVLWLTVGLPALMVPAILINGGDWIPHHRLLIPYLPVLSIAIGSAATALTDGRLPRGMRNATFLLLPLVLLPLGLDMLRDQEWRLRPAITTQLDPVCWGPLSDRLATVLTADDRVAVEVLGIVGYQNPRVYVHDMLSLTDPVGAQRGRFYMPMIGKFDPGHTLNTIKPTVIVFGADAFFLPALRTVASFDADYETSVVSVRGANCPDGHLFMSVRNDSRIRIAAGFPDLGSRRVSPSF
jgi:arabinofuranosyltransferase